MKMFRLVNGEETLRLADLGLEYLFTQPPQVASPGGVASGGTSPPQKAKMSGPRLPAYGGVGMKFYYISVA